MTRYIDTVRQAPYDVDGVTAGTSTVSQTALNTLTTNNCIITRTKPGGIVKAALQLPTVGYLAGRQWSGEKVLPPRIWRGRGG